MAHHFDFRWSVSLQIQGTALAHMIYFQSRSRSNNYGYMYMLSHPAHSLLTMATMDNCNNFVPRWKYSKCSPPVQSTRSSPVIVYSLIPAIVGFSAVIDKASHFLSEYVTMAATF